MLAFALVKAQTTVTANEDSPCAVCWDGSLGQFDGTVCACPRIPVKEPEVVEEEPTSEDQAPANPNCTNGNAGACNKSNG